FDEHNLCGAPTAPAPRFVPASVPSRMLDLGRFVPPAGGTRVQDLRRKGGQWAKCRVPVKYRVIPAALAAAMVSSSRTEPPGWTTARTPASASTMNPSGNGKYASDAATAPADREPARATASRAASTRLTCPMPTPTV